MTSFAFILGCVPLWTAEGAGGVSRQIIGTAVIGGMLTASFIAIFLIPVFFYLVEKFSGGKEKIESKAPQLEAAGASHPAPTTEH
jgi:HAE1 family hydrophobic/amphiphilic exporter-1